MDFLIIIPAYNEAEYIGQTIESLAAQVYMPTHVAIVNDASSDNTAEIVKPYAERFPWLTLIDKTEKEKRASGAKVVRAFNHGYQQMKDRNHDVVMKMDADLILPTNYFEKVNALFEADDRIGMAGGTCVVLRNGNWIPEGVSNPDHLRGPIKSYRRACFEEMGGLVEAMGWDTIDQIKARFRGWKVAVDMNLHVKHLRETNAASRWTTINMKNGRYMYRCRYGVLLGLTSSLKRGLVHPPRPWSGFVSFWGFIKAWMKGESFLLSSEEGAFARAYRRKIMKRRLGVR